MTPTADVVVVGAGIVGASVAYHLARAGSVVVLLDKALPASGATCDSFAWIGRGTADAPPEQLPLRRSVLDDYRRLERELPAVHVRWTGSLSWRHDEPAVTDDDPRDRQDIDTWRVTQLEPHLLTPPVRAALRADDGAVDPVAVVEALIGGAHDHGATIRTGIAAQKLTLREDTVLGVQTSAGFLPARKVVLASGADAPMLCAPLGFALPVTASPALLMRFTAAPGVVRTLVANDQLEVRETADGHLLVPWEYDGQTSQQDLDRAGKRALGQLRASFSGTGDVELVSVRVGARPMPADGSPVIGPVPTATGAYLAVMHSGVTLAPTVGRLVAREITDGTDADELRSLRPSRFT